MELEVVVESHFSGQNKCRIRLKIRLFLMCDGTASMEAYLAFTTAMNEF